MNPGRLAGSNPARDRQNQGPREGWRGGLSQQAWGCLREQWGLRRQAEFINQTATCEQRGVIWPSGSGVAGCWPTCGDYRVALSERRARSVQRLQVPPPTKRYSSRNIKVALNDNDAQMQDAITIQRSMGSPFSRAPFRRAPSSIR